LGLRTVTHYIGGFLDGIGATIRSLRILALNTPVVGSHVHLSVIGLRNHVQHPRQPAIACPVPVTTGRQRRGLETRSLLRGSGCRSAKVIAIHAPDYVNADLLWAGFLTLAEQSAATEAFRIHL